jgi:hypothetical protein
MGSNRVPICGVECFKERVIQLEGLKDEKDRERSRKTERIGKYIQLEGLRKSFHYVVLRHDDR